MKFFQYMVVLMASLGLIACEQAQLFGPVGGAMVSVTELRSGDTVVTGEFTDDADAARITYPIDWDSLAPVQQALFLGHHQFTDSSVFEDETWYLMRVEGGDDYFADGNLFAEPTPVPVNGAIHAIFSGAQLKAAGNLVTPITEAVYQYVKDFLDVLTDEELAALLDSVAAELVADIEADDDIDYGDVIKYNRALHFNAANLVVATADVDALTTAMTNGDTEQTNALADALFSAPAPAGVPEKIYEASIEPLIQQQSCGPSCHEPDGSGALLSENVLLPSSSEGYAEANTENFRMLVETNGLEYVIDKAAGNIQHTGSGIGRIETGTADGDTFEAWLNLL